jgi:hypothetical protein
MAISYGDACVPIRADLPAAHQERFEALARPGSWWSGAERVAIAEEVRNAAACTLCRERKQALSPEAVDGEHDSPGTLPAHAIDVIHRVTTDPARLSRRWFDSVIDSGLTVGAYVEIIGTVVSIVSIDSFCWAMGLPPNPLPEPRAGEPSRYQPPGLVEGIAWVPILDPKNLGPAESDLFSSPRTGNVIRALSLVPDEVRALRVLSKAHYLEMAAMLDFGRGLSIDRMQVEFVAARVSALNECFY